MAAWGYGGWRAYRQALVYDPCAYCGGGFGEPGLREHILPRAVGGGGKGTGTTMAEWPNLTSTCVACNTDKCKKSLLQFLLERSEAADLSARR